MVVILRLHTLEYYEKRMKCAAFNSLNSVASIENQNVAFESNRLMLRGIRMGQKNYINVNSVKFL